MAQRFFDFNLTIPSFPMLSKQQTRTTIVPNDGETTAAGTPSLAYCHNVMPTTKGLTSVGYNKVASTGILTDLVASLVAYSTDKEAYTVFFNSIGFASAIAHDGSISGFGTPSIANPFDPTKLTSAKVNGVTYMYYAGDTAYTLVFASKYGAFNIQANPLVGLDETTILGIAASGGYLVAYTEDALAWSSTLDPTDFVPSQTTGAGGGNIAGLAGKIVAVTSNSLGLLIYSEGNVIAATLTGNSRYPFTFREVVNSRGALDYTKIAYQSNAAEQYALTRAGLQAINSQQATTVLPELTDFLAGNLFEDYNEVTKEYETAVIPEDEVMAHKIAFLNSRYLVVSYGVTELTHALVLDTALNRLGKLKFTHLFAASSVASFANLNRSSIQLVGTDGNVYEVDMTEAATTGGVAVFGKIQYTNSRMTNLLGVSVENVEEGDNLSVSTQASLDGKTFTVVEGTTRESVAGMREYYFRKPAKSHSVTLVGKFDLVTLLIRYATQGRR